MSRSSSSCGQIMLGNVCNIQGVDHFSWFQWWCRGQQMLYWRSRKSGKQSWNVEANVEVSMSTMGADDLQYRVRKSDIAMSAKEAKRKGTRRSEEKGTWMLTRAPRHHDPPVPMSTRISLHDMAPHFPRSLPVFVWLICCSCCVDSTTNIAIVEAGRRLTDALWMKQEDENKAGTGTRRRRGRKNIKGVRVWKYATKNNSGVIQSWQKNTKKTYRDSNVCTDRHATNPLSVVSFLVTLKRDVTCSTSSQQLSMQTLYPAK